jgi:NADH-quinone oxidoreductase subunit E
MPEMTDIETQMNAMNRAYAAMLPKEMAGAFNLMAHPMAGAAAAGALGLGLASHALGLWLGSIAGAAEASQKLFSDTAGAETRVKGTKRATLKLVQATPAPEDAAAAARTVAADAEIAAREVVRATKKATEATLADAEALVQPKAETKPRPAKAPSETKTAASAALSKPAGVEKPAVLDDLKTISGIGPKLEKVLNDLGIWTYDQIAAFTVAEIAWLDDHLGFSGRIGRDDWVGQAKALSVGPDAETAASSLQG